MNILATQFSLETKSLDIYLAGCRGPHCENCHNPESWNFDQGIFYDDALDPIWEKVDKFGSLIDRVMVMGGEPLDQDGMCLSTLLHACTLTGKELWLFTGKGPMQVPSFVKQYCDYLKCGRYEENLRGEKEQYGIKLASTNQHIFKKGVDF